MKPPFWFVSTSPTHEQLPQSACHTRGLPLKLLCKHLTCAQLQAVHLSKGSFTRGHLLLPLCWSQAVHLSKGLSQEVTYCYLCVDLNSPHPQLQAALPLPCPSPSLKQPIPCVILDVQVYSFLISSNTCNCYIYIYIFRHHGLAR